MGAFSETFNGAISSSFILASKAFDVDLSTATQKDLGALAHAVDRHGSELSNLIGEAIEWGPMSERQNMLDNFNDAIEMIESNGAIIGQEIVNYGKKGSGLGAVPTLVNVYNYVHDGVTYYTHRRVSDNQYVSGGEVK